jgi:hypothetical protein
MRTLVALLVLGALLAGCTGSSYNCPAAYGPEYKKAYMEALDQLAKQNIAAPADADHDCVPDVVEAKYKTDPNDANSYPSLEQLGGSSSGVINQVPGTGNATAQPKPVVYTASGTMTAGVGSNPGVSFSLGAPNASGAVKAGATLVYVEMKWDTPFDLNLCVHLPASGSTGPAANCDPAVPSNGLPGMPDSPATFTYKAPPTGDWSVTPYTNGGAAATNVDIAFTVFYGETAVPAGYTAL